MDTTPKHQAALSFLKSHKTGVLATLSPEGNPRARTIYYACDDAFNIYFFTYAGTRKADDLILNQPVAFVVSSEVPPQTFQVEGVATDITATATLDESMKHITELVNEHGPRFAPITHMDSNIIHYYKLTPTWMRWGDFTSGQNNSEVFTHL